MSREVMERLCPGARALGLARLPGWRFVIARCGYASLSRAPCGTVLGVLWSLTSGHVASLNAYEGVDRGLYLRRSLRVRHGGANIRALVYVTPAGGEGGARPGYLGVVLAAARDWDLPAPYVAALARRSAGAWRGRLETDVGFT